MKDNHPKTSSIEKTCHDNECIEKIAALPTDQAALFKKFTYCPFCAEELVLICQNCREQLDSSEYKFCPWCGVKFDENQDDLAKDSEVTRRP
ncbi:MAG: hypothetical protein LBW85_09555 [Deltaproteobacteria bacterium]|jgi:predicted RNA-binding Zn-ribbon protein involved in translation (DUF1610 family)|nr:hypothetical protein [Deltaproteobacteria bacterium]